jgi:hypothetical protein
VVHITRDGTAFRLDVDGVPAAADSAALLDAIDALSRARRSMGRGHRRARSASALSRARST